MDDIDARSVDNDALTDLKDHMAERVRWDQTKQRRIQIEILKDDLIRWLLDATKPAVASGVLSVPSNILVKTAELRALEAIENGA